MPNTILALQSADFSTMELIMIETCVRNRVDEINEMEGRGFNPDGSGDIRGMYESILRKITVAVPVDKQ